MRFLAIFSGLVLFAASYTSAAETGNIQIVLSDSASRHGPNLSVELDHFAMTTPKLTGDAFLFWSVATGLHTLTIKVTGDTTCGSCQFTVYPGLTNRLKLSKSSNGPVITDNGFADQSAPMLTFDSKTLNNLPGEFTDGVGIFAGDQTNSSHYSWEGLPYRSSGWSWDQSPTLKGAPFSALVNLGDPFAGYDNADISMFSEADSLGSGDIQFTYATRDQRRFRENSNTPLMHGKGVLAVSFAGENSADASPRWNVDSILPHNNTKNGEMAIKFRYDDQSKSRFNLLFLEKHNERLYYLQPYHFDYIHAPKEKTVSLRGQADYQYTARPDLIFSAGAGWSLDDRKYGDGVYFDNVMSYSRSQVNYGTIFNNILWSWDNRSPQLDTIYDPLDTIDEGHIYEGYRRDKLTGYRFNLGAQKILFGTTNIAARIAYKLSEVRRYLNNYPTYGDFSYSTDNLGFDTVGSQSIDQGIGNASPSPKEFLLTVEGGQIRPNTFWRVAVDYQRFDPGAKTFKDFGRPFNPGGISEYDTLDAGDLRDARTLSVAGYRMAAGLEFSRGWDIVAASSLTYQMPDYDYRYTSLHHVYTKIFSGSFEIFGNPELEPIHRKVSSLSIKAHSNRGTALVSLFRREVSNLPTPYHFVAVPRSFDMYQSTDIEYYEERLTGLSLTAQGRLNQLLTCAASATYTHGHHPPDQDYVTQIAWFDPRNNGKTDFPTYSELRAGLSIGCDFSHAANIPNTVLGRLAHGISIFATANYKSGLRYIPTSINSEINFYSTRDYYLTNETRKAKDFIELNLGLNARLVDKKAFRFMVRLEILNLLNRANYLAVYSGTGSPTDDGYLNTPQGQSDYPATSGGNNSGLTYEQAYWMVLNDPNHFSRPRMIRIAAIMGF